MKLIIKSCMLITLIFTNYSVSAEGTIAAAPNGIELPVGYQNWRVIGVSHRTDNNSLRAIVGNNIAVNAAHTGHTDPWPTGTILGKLVWKDGQHPDWDQATVPDRLSHIEFMIKDQAKYLKTGGWGYARWVGDEAKPYGDNADFDQECYSCHSKVKQHDYVFTRPVKLPTP